MLIIGEKLLVLVVELRSRVYDVISSVIEPIFSSYVLFHPVERLQQLFRSRLREVDVTHPIVGFSVKHLCEAFSMKKRSRLKSSPQRDLNRGPLGRNITKRTVFHWASRPWLLDHLYSDLFLFIRTLYYSTLAIDNLYPIPHTSRSSHLFLHFRVPVAY